MNASELFDGIAVVIDDELGKKNKNINNIVRQIENRHIPVLQYKELPNLEEIKNFKSISFILLDWRLFDLQKEESVHVPQGLIDENNHSNIEFLKRVFHDCFCPIFIFTNETDTDNIERILFEANLYNKNKPTRIFIKQKAQLVNGNKLFKEVEKWIKETPSIYVLKKWQYEYNLALKDFFNDFQGLSPYWPVIMWNNYKDDGADESLELSDLLLRSVVNRIMPMKFSSEILQKDQRSVSVEELRNILQGEKFIKEESLLKKNIITGDIFIKQNKKTDEMEYLINIRAQCDLVREKNPVLYCLRGKEVVQDRNGNINGIKFSNGEYPERNNHVIAPFINDKIIEFKFKDLLQYRNSTLKKHRIGRLLPPYIIKIQQKYSLYLQRQGLPRIPDEAILPQEQFAKVKKTR
jgi:hypothetical protein